jgi:hypothetical protein
MFISYIRCFCVSLAEISMCPFNNFSYPKVIWIPEDNCSGQTKHLGWSEWTKVLEQEPVLLLIAQKYGLIKLKGNNIGSTYFI